MRNMIVSELDRTRPMVSATLDRKRRSKLGQFMTPGAIANLMASMFHDLPSSVRLLDAGAGMGALTAAFVEAACKLERPPTSIDVTVFEVDEVLIEVLNRTLAACAKACKRAGIKFSGRIVQDDYIMWSSRPLLNAKRSFNRVILNPPYGKINSSSQWRAGLRTLGIETVNLYTAFVALAIQQLEDGGELVAITPRSFCNGPYYEPFRRLLLGETALLAIHEFQSRKTAFKDDDVLQENIIFKIRKGGNQDGVELSTDQTAVRLVPFSEIVSPADPHAFIRLPTQSDTKGAKVHELPCTLEDLGISVSTGRVVDFRVREHLRKMPDQNTVPLIYPAHFKNGFVTGPIPDFKKYNALADNEETASQIVPAGIYVLTKRFSAKEERRRLVAAVYDGDRAAFENHLNFFHRKGEGLSPRLASGLAAFLNSEPVDQYFRTFSGHTQVNATDLRNLRYPQTDQLEALGSMKGDIDKAVYRLL
jgi:adenine-specific DNA-methyltransferase